MMSQREYPAIPRKMAHPLEVTSHFLVSGLAVMTLITYFVVWSRVATYLTGDDTYAISGFRDILITLSGAGVIIFLALGGFAWLVLCGYFSRGALIRELNRKIEELEKRKEHL
jgi:hypothetical protein